MIETKKPKKKSVKPAYLVRLKAVVFYEPSQLFTPAVLDHLNSLRIYSSMDILYAPLMKSTLIEFDLDFFDVVIIHYSVRLVFDAIPEDFEQKLQQTSAKIVIFCQDEYDYSKSVRRFINSAKAEIVFTCTPRTQIENVYPKRLMPHTQFHSVLTGYAPIGFGSTKDQWAKLKDRPIKIGHRGRELPFYYGNLGFEKFQMCLMMKKLCTEHDIIHDIEWTEDKRIYNEDWSEFLRSSVATLITESGSNLFDHDGEIRNKINAYVSKNPKAPYEEVSRTFNLDKLEKKFKMQQISPRAFEAIVNGTVLIGFKGQYSGILKPGIHYIVLNRDFSNVEDVFTQLGDLDHLEMMRDAAYDDIIAGEKWTYKQLVNRIDKKVYNLFNITKFQRRKSYDDETIKRMATQTLPYKTLSPMRASLSNVPYGKPEIQIISPIFSRLSKFKRLSSSLRTVVNKIPGPWIVFLKRFVPKSLVTMLGHIYRS